MLQIYPWQGWAGGLLPSRAILQAVPLTPRSARPSRDPAPTLCPSAPQSREKKLQGHSKPQVTLENLPEVLSLPNSLKCEFKKKKIRLQQIRIYYGINCKIHRQLHSFNLKPE